MARSFLSMGGFNHEWAADSAYEDLYPGIPIEKAREMNKIPHAVATAFGLDLRHPKGKALFDEYFRLANTKAFCGPWSNLNNPNHWEQHPDRMGHCGPEFVLGHRHDQTALSVIVHRLGIQMTQCPEFFAFAPPAENTILCSVGA